MERMSRFYLIHIFQVLRLALSLSPLRFKVLHFQSENKEKEKKKNKWRLLQSPDI